MSFKTETRNAVGGVSPVRLWLRPGIRNLNTLAGQVSCDIYDRGEHRTTNAEKDPGNICALQNGPENPS